MTQATASDPMHSGVRRARPYVLYGLLTGVFCAPLFEVPAGLGILDWDQHLFYYASVLKSVVEYGQMPFWNPWYCGGNVLWQNPQIPLLSPVFPLAAIVSLPLAMKINIAFHYLFGFAGMHLLLTSALGLRFMPLVVYLAAVVTLSGAPAMHLAVGHSVFLPGFYLPFQLFAYLRAVQTGRFRYIAVASALLALMIYNGAVHVVPMSIGATMVFALCVTTIRREWRPLLMAAAVVALGCAYAAPKLLPVLAFVSDPQFVDARTRIVHPDQMTVEMLVRTYLDPFQNRGLQFDLQRSAWYEYGNYIGALALFLIIASAGWAFVGRGSRDRWLGVSLAVTAVVLLALSAGEFSPFAPASIATHLPLFSSFRIPSRYTMAFVVFGVTTVAWAWRAVDGESMPTATRRWFLGAICVLGTLDLLVHNRAHLSGSFPNEPLQGSFRLFRGVNTLSVNNSSSPYVPGSPMLNAIMNDTAFYRCYESLQLRRRALPDAPLIESDGKSKIFSTSFSPNRVEFSVAAGREPSHVLLNQNMARGWQSTTGLVTVDAARGRPGVTVQPGQAGTFAFYFVPPGLITGGVVFVLALVVTAALSMRGHVRKPRARTERDQAEPSGS